MPRSNCKLLFEKKSENSVNKDFSVTGDCELFHSECIDIDRCLLYAYKGYKMIGFSQISCGRKLPQSA